MTGALLTDPYLWGIAILTVVAVGTFIWPPLAEMTGLRTEADGDDLPPWLVVIGGWATIGMAIWAVVGLWRGLGWLVTR